MACENDEAMAIRWPMIREWKGHYICIQGHGNWHAPTPLYTPRNFTTLLPWNPVRMANWNKFERRDKKPSVILRYIQWTAYFMGGKDERNDNHTIQPPTKASLPVWYWMGVMRWTMKKFKETSLTCISQLAALKVYGETGTRWAWAFYNWKGVSHAQYYDSIIIKCTMSSTMISTHLPPTTKVTVYEMKNYIWKTSCMNGCYGNIKCLCP